MTAVVLFFEAAFVARLAPVAGSPMLVLLLVVVTALFLALHD